MSYLKKCVIYKWSTFGFYNWPLLDVIIQWMCHCAFIKCLQTNPLLSNLWKSFFYVYIFILQCWSMRDCFFIACLYIWLNVVEVSDVFHHLKTFNVDVKRINVIILKCLRASECDSVSESKDMVCCHLFIWKSFFHLTTFVCHSKSLFWADRSSCFTLSIFTTALRCFYLR